MERAEILNMVSEMFLTIKLISGYPIPQLLPPVHFIPLEQIQQMVCAGPCQVKAFYLPDKGVFINNTVDLTDAFARSILLHELVHHVQHVSGKFDAMGNACDRWFSKELEAYRIQNQYLRENNEARRFLMDSLPRMCADTMPPAVGK